MQADDLIWEKPSKKRRGFKKSQVELLKLKTEGKCQECGRRFYEKGVGRSVVHHKDGDRNNDDTSNIMIVCLACHDKLTLEQQAKKKGTTKPKDDKLFPEDEDDRKLRKILWG